MNLGSELKTLAIATGVVASVALLAFLGMRVISGTAIPAPVSDTAAGFHADPPRDSNALKPATTVEHDAAQELRTTNARQPVDAGPEYSSLASLTAAEVSAVDLDKGVVGKPFPISPVARPRCDPASGFPVGCEDERRLEEFTQEPRERAWAGAAEDALISKVAELSPEFSIRNVECRLITCVIEVESPEILGTFGPKRDLKPAEWRKYHLKPFSGTNAGLSESGAWVSVRIYERIR